MAVSGQTEKADNGPPVGQKGRRSHADSMKNSPRSGVATSNPDTAIGDRGNPANGITVDAFMFRIFIIDSGWNSPAGKVLRNNFHLVRALEQDTPIYVLGRERSIEYMRRYPMLVGRDPIIRVNCEPGAANHKPGFHGFRLHLGRLKREEEALQAL